MLGSKFPYPCGATECWFPFEYCQKDTEDVEQSICKFCVRSFCDFIRHSSFPNECTFFCNGSTFLRESFGKEDDSNTCLPHLYLYLLLIICLILSIAIIFTYTILRVKYRISLLDILKATFKINNDKINHQTSVMLTASLTERKPLVLKEERCENQTESSIVQHPSEDINDLPNVVRLQQISPSNLTDSSAMVTTAAVTDCEMVVC